jgi:hypothetical protein
LTERLQLHNLGAYFFLEVFVRILFTAGLVVLFSAALVGAPAMAAPASPASAPLGVVLQADHAQLGAVVTSGGATIYDGDRLQTNGEGTLRATLGGPQLYLRNNTITQVHSLPNGFSADLAGGTVIVSSTEGQTFQLLVDGAIIRPVGTQSVVAQVTRVSATELRLSSNRGAFEVAMGDEVRTVNAGTAYRMEVEPDTASSDPGPQGNGPYHPGRKRKTLLWIAIAGASAGAGIGVWRALVSPSAP